LVLSGTQFSLAPANRVSVYANQAAGHVGIPDTVEWANVVTLNVPA
jgi:hypothetical protein